MVSASPFADRALAQMLPLRDAFVALFFVTVGVLINPRNVLDSPGFLLAILLLVIVGKFIVWTVVVKLFRYLLTTPILVGVGLTQIGEFSFIFVQVARAPMGWLATPVTRRLWRLPCCRFWRTPRLSGRFRRCCQRFPDVYQLNNPSPFRLESGSSGAYTFLSSRGSSSSVAQSRPSGSVASSPLGK